MTEYSAEVAGLNDDERRAAEAEHAICLERWERLDEDTNAGTTKHGVDAHIVPRQTDAEREAADDTMKAWDEARVSHLHRVHYGYCALAQSKNRCDCTAHDDIAEKIAYLVERCRPDGE